MAAISAKDIMSFREETGLPMMECKKALEEAGGDRAKALEILRKRGMDKAAKKADRSTNSGVVEAYSHEGRIGVLVEVLCETDFVARNEEFKQLAHDLALQVAAMSPKYVSPDSVPAEVVEEQRNRASEQARSEGKPEAVIEKIANGKLEKYYSEVCLLNQAFIKDQDKTVGELVNEKVAKIGERIQVARFVRFELGESSDKSI